MNTNKTGDARISALADSCLDDAQHEQLFRTLDQPEARQAWETYHCIGDVLRSPDTAVLFSAGFATKMAAMLAAEPAHLGAAAIAAPVLDSSVGGDWHVGMMLRKFGMRGAGVAAAVVLTLVAIPKLGLQHHGGVSGESVASVTSSAGHAGIAASEVLRNPQIDEYLLAHQRYSPSVYSTAQLARSAIFSTNK